MEKNRNKRAHRREQTLKVARRRREIHLRDHHGGDPSEVDCICELADTYFAKQSISCRCRKRQKGNPRAGGFGPCHPSGHMPVRYHRRAQVRYLKFVIRDGYDPESDFVTCVATPIPNGIWRGWRPRVIRP